MSTQRASEFETFWASYPRRVGKFAALKAYAKARTVATAEEILAGVEAYRQHKPDYADYCHPTTWLNQGRWMDQYDEVRPRVQGKTAGNVAAALRFVARGQAS